MKKRILSIALVVAMIVVMIPAMLLPTAALSYYDGYETAIVAEGAITVDAAETPDAVYLNSEKITSMSRVAGQGETSSFVAYTAADQYGLYLHIDMVDQSLDKDEGVDVVVDTDDETGEDITEKKYASADIGDKFQIYIRATSGKAYGVGCLEIDYLGQVIATTRKGNIDKTAMDIKTATYDDNWVVELYIPWTALDAGFEGETVDDFNTFKIGLQVCNNNAVWNVEKGQFEGQNKAYCYDNKHGGSYYRGIYGHAFASGDATGGYEASKCVPLSFSGTDVAVVGDTITVDGKMEAAYTKSEAFDCYVGAGYENFSAYSLATVDGIYTYVEIIDDTLDKAPEKTVDKGDKFQLYFQMGNSFNKKNWGYVEIDYRTNEELGEGVTNFRYLAKGGWQMNAPKAEEILYATAKKYDAQGNALGWTAEVFIPWYGELAYNNVSELNKYQVALGLQANNYTNDDKAITYCLSDRWGSAFWYGEDGYSTAGPAGSFYLTPVRLVFDNAPEKIDRWAKYSATDLTLDGAKDDAYSEFATDLVNYVYVSTSQGSTETLAGGWHYGDFVIGKAYYAFTDTDMYILVEVYDDMPSPTTKTEYACVYYENSTHAGKWNLTPKQTYNTNATYEGESVDYPALTNGTNGVNLAITYQKGDGVGTMDDYTGYTVEFKMPLPEAEKVALAAGKAVDIRVGIEINDSKAVIEGDDYANGERRWYGFNATETGTLWYQSGTGVYGHVAMPKVTLNKALTDANYDVTPEITSAQVALGESINMNYFATLPLNATDAKMQFTFNGETYLANAAVTDVANEYVFTFTGIAPQCMGDNIKAELIVDGEVVATKDNYSVFANCMSLVEKNPTDAKLIQLVADLGAYGAAAQVYAGYKTDALVNAGYEDLATKVTAIENSDRVIGEALETFGFTAAGVYFNNTNKLYIKAVINAEALAFVTVTINGEEVALTATGNENEYIVYTDEILVTEFDDVYTFVITDGTDSQTVTYSVNAYCKAKLGAAKAATAALAAATYAYGASAVAYAG